MLTPSHSRGEWGFLSNFYIQHKWKYIVINGNIVFWSHFLESPDCLSVDGHSINKLSVDKKLLAKDMVRFRIRVKFRVRLGLGLGLVDSL